MHRSWRGAGEEPGITRGGRRSVSFVKTDFFLREVPACSVGADSTATKKVNPPERLGKEATSLPEGFRHKVDDRSRR